MAANSTIEWTEATWNPVVGCSKKSPGCKHCYAIRVVQRLAGNPNAKVRAANEGLSILQGGELNWTGKVRCLPDRLQIPLRRKKPTTYFVNSLSDLFHRGVPDDFIDQVFAVMALCPQHRFQVLTKTADRMVEYFSAKARGGARGRVWDRAYLKSMLWPVATTNEWPLPNVWLGVSAESQKYADERIPSLLQTPAAVRFLSAEPLLGPVSFRWADWAPLRPHPYANNHLDGMKGIDWVIVGGESGRGSRPMHPDWARWIRDQCRDAGVPFFFKQWGEFGLGSSHQKPLDSPGRIYVWGDGTTRRLGDPPPATDFRDGFIMERVGKKAAGRLLDGREWNEMPFQSIVQRVEQSEGAEGVAE